MDLTYSPGELDYKKENVPTMTRDQESVDDFEHLDPESYSAEKQPKPLSEVDTKHKGDIAHETDTIILDKNTHQSKNIVESSSNQSLLDLGIAKEGPINPIFDAPNHELNSDFISSEKSIQSSKSDTGSDVLGLQANLKNANIPMDDTIVNEHNDSEIPKSMKEADALSQYMLKQDKNDIGKNEEILNEKHELHDISEPVLNVDKSDGFNTNGDQRDNLSIKHPTDIDRKTQLVTDEKEDGNSNVENKLKESNSLERDELKSISDGFVTIKPESKMLNEPFDHKDETQVHAKESPRTQDTGSLVTEMCICPSKPNFEDTSLDDIIGPADIFKRIGLVEALIYWREPKKSGVVFGTVMAILLSLCYMSLISVVAYSFSLLLVAAISFRVYKNILQAVQKNGEGHPFKQYLDMELSLSQEKVREFTDTAVVHVNAAIIELRRLILVEDLIDSLKFLSVMWFLTYVGAIFNGITLVILAFVALFTVPKIYENNKETIDTFIELMRAKVADITAKVKAAVPIGKKETEVKAKDKEQ